MHMVLKNASLPTVKENEDFTLVIADGVIEEILPAAAPLPPLTEAFMVDCSGLTILPGLADVHVHLRQGGFSYKETMATGTLAAAAGGITALVTMPNILPPPDDVENLAYEQRLIDSFAMVDTRPLATITKGGRGRGELVDFAALAPHCAGFSDDGFGVQDEALMREAMEGIAKADSILVAHVEDESLAAGGLAHDGVFARRHGLAGNPSASEYTQLARDMRLVAETGCRYHACHLSTKESVAIIRKAKADGLPVTCETAPHYLALCDEDLQNEGRFKMNPPVRAIEDQKALVEGVKDGTIDIIATDHAPHSALEKRGDFKNSLNGIIGLEISFPVCYTKLVKSGGIPLSTLLMRMCTAPRKLFDLAYGQIAIGRKADLFAADLGTSYLVDPLVFMSMGKATPFAGESLFGRVCLTLADGRMVYNVLPLQSISKL
jgi:dihydroorotase